MNKIWLIPFCFLLTFVFASAQKQSATIEYTPRLTEKVKKEFPYDITMVDTSGKQFASSKILNTKIKLTVLVFWATTCAPCRMELKAYNQKWQEWQKQFSDFNLVAVSIDFDDRHTAAMEVPKKENWQFASYVDVRREFPLVMPGNLNGLPQLFILDKKGSVLYEKKRYLPGDEDELFQKIQELSREH